MDFTAELDVYCKKIAKDFKQYPEALSVAFEACLEHNGNPEKIRGAVMDAYRKDSLIKKSERSPHKSFTNCFDSLKAASSSLDWQLELDEIKRNLTDFEKQVCDLLLEGYSPPEIVIILQSYNKQVYGAIDVIGFRLENGMY